MSMNIHSAAGVKVIFGNPNSGYDYDREECSKYLKVGNIYTVERTEVHSFHTDVWIKEVPNVRFNSVMFNDAESAGGK